MKKKILLFAKHQFGQLTDTYKYAEYSKDLYDLTYLGWDYEIGKQYLDGIEVIYISRKGNLFIRNFRLLKSLDVEIKSGKFDLIFAHYVRGISIVKLLNWNTKIILDIRTLSISKKVIKRILFNLFLKLESLFFKNKSIISCGVAKKLRIKNYNLLPVGSDCMRSSEINFNRSNIHLLYVGTLDGRDIIKCVKGFKKYLLRTNNLEAKLTIVGDSNGLELDEILDYVSRNNLQNNIFCTGRVDHGLLDFYFSSANIGVSFIPITKWFNFQPPTKTFEYLLSGLPLIATKTFENIKLLKDEYYCELISDTEDEFSEAIYNISFKLKEFVPGIFSDKYNNHLWKEIIEKYFIQIINRSL